MAPVMEEREGGAVGNSITAVEISPGRRMEIDRFTLQQSSHCASFLFYMRGCYFITADWDIQTSLEHKDIHSTELFEATLKYAGTFLLQITKEIDTMCVFCCNWSQKCAFVHENRHKCDRNIVCLSHHADGSLQLQLLNITYSSFSILL